MVIGRSQLVSRVTAAIILTLALVVSVVCTPFTVLTARADSVTEASAINIWYVNQNATGSANGTSWADACNYLQDALTSAGTGDQIWVAAGTYRPDQGDGETPGDKTATFALINNVAIYGGFVGGEVSPDQRDWQNNQTILSGDLGGGNNSYNVVTGSSTDGTAIMDGFIITAGNANGPSAPSYYGGGLYNYGGSPTLLNCTFSENAADRDGGGIYNYGGNFTLINCTFDRNAAGSDGGGMFNEEGSPTLINCTFDRNVAGGDGGGMFNYKSSSPILTDCVFTGNSGDKGGGILNNESSGALTGCSFNGNSADIGGGIANFEESSPTVINCIFTGNSATGYGGGMLNDDSSPDAINCTFSGNSAVYGGGMDNYNSYLTIANCILWGNTATNGAQLAVGSGSTLTISNSDVQGGKAGIFDNGGGIINWGTGNIDADPGFVDADGVDNIVGTLDDDLRLSAGSPCIDTGDNTALPASITTDIDGLKRSTDGDNDGTDTVDMGAHEFESEAQTPEEQIEDIADGIEDLVSKEVLNEGQGNALVSKLLSALSALGKGNTNAAVNKLNAFINQVNAFEKSDILTEDEADTLRNAAQDVIDSI